MYKILFFLIIPFLAFGISYIIGRLHDSHINRIWTPSSEKLPKSSEDVLYFFTNDHEMHLGKYNFDADKFKPWKDTKTMMQYSSNQVERWCKESTMPEKEALLEEENEFLYNKGCIYLITFVVAVEIFLAFKIV